MLVTDGEEKREFHWKATKYTFFPNAQKTFSKIKHLLDLETTLNKFKKNEIISHIFFNFDSKRLQIKDKKRKLQKPQTHGV